MKKLQTFDIYPNLEGATLTDGSVIVNIEYIWEITNGDEDLFIKEFGDILSHEMIHQQIRSIIKSVGKYAYGEERAVRLMLNQKFSEREKKFYNDKKKATTIRFR